jgi:2-C-methyl-D-erythritol 2,4-cyclodiphosphate synthase
MEYRVGIGYDIHRLVEGRRCVIGGVEIPYVKGLLGHSDADVLLHALCDAILGAAGAGDIGELFPDTDPKFCEANSKQLLKTVAGMVAEKGFRIVNVDTVIIAQEPKLMSFKQKIKETVAELLSLDPGCVGVKAKTNEGLGEIGKIEAIACFASAAVTRGE